MIGHGKFLRGTGGIHSADKAVQVLEDKSEVTVTYFMLGLYCIVMSSALKAFILYTLWNAIIVLLGLMVMTYYLIKAGKYRWLHLQPSNLSLLIFSIGRRIFNELYVEKDDKITGKINKDQIFDPTNVQFR